MRPNPQAHFSMRFTIVLRWSARRIRRNSILLLTFPLRNPCRLNPCRPYHRRLCLMKMHRSNPTASRPPPRLEHSGTAPKVATAVALLLRIGPPIGRGRFIPGRCGTGERICCFATFLMQCGEKLPYPWCTAQSSRWHVSCHTSKSRIKRPA